MVTRTGYKVIAEGRRFQARYYDKNMRLWFDLGDPKDTEADALDLIDRTIAEKNQPCECIIHCSQGTGGCRLDGTEHVHPDLGECPVHPEAPRSEG